MAKQPFQATNLVYGLCIGTVVATAAISLGDIFNRSLTLTGSEDGDPAGTTFDNIIAGAPNDTISAFTTRYGGAAYLVTRDPVGKTLCKDVTLWPDRPGETVKFYLYARRICPKR